MSFEFGYLEKFVLRKSGCVAHGFHYPHREPHLQCVHAQSHARVANSKSEGCRSFAEVRESSMNQTELWLAGKALERVHGRCCDVHSIAESSAGLCS